MKTPTFAVIMPLFNKAPYVRKAIESVVAQTRGDWELWVVDDGSTDGSADVVVAFNDPRIHLHRQANAGVGTARNKGVALSGKGASSEAAFRSPTTEAPYLCFLDADDWWEPTFLEDMASLIDRHPDAGIYGTGYTIVSEHNHKTRVASIGVPEGFTEGEINYCQVYARNLCMPLWTGAVCVPRAVFDEQGGFPEDVRIGEDFLLWIHIALKHQVVLLNKPLSNYNQDVDIASRGTHHLHHPQHNMLWHLGDLEPLEKNHPDYKTLVDALRTHGLQSYLLDHRYWQAAQKELDKVDWNRQSSATRRYFRQPRWIQRLHITFKTLCSKCKQELCHFIR